MSLTLPPADVTAASPAAVAIVVAMLAAMAEAVGDEDGEVEFSPFLIDILFLA